MNGIMVYTIDTVIMEACDRCRLVLSDSREFFMAQSDAHIDEDGQEHNWTIAYTARC